MNLDLAAIYNTPGAPSAEDLSKTASIELFAKLAADQNIDLNAMTEDQVQTLYNDVMGKQASDDEEDKDKGALKDIKNLEKHEKKEIKDDEEEKKAAAEAEFAVQQEWTQKQAEADYLGRVMAHAYVNELNSIKEASEQTETKEAGFKDLMNKAKEHGGKHLENVGKKTMKHVGRTGGAEGAANPTTAKRVGAGAYGAGAAAAGGAAAASKKKKEASAIDQLALDAAVKLASDNGWDAEEAAERVYAVSVLGLGESQKIAAAQDTDGAVHIRALEYLEAAGYEVSWE